MIASSEKKISSNLSSPLWLFCAAVALSLSWLLPNHTPPWLGFHSDAVSAVVFSCLCLWILFISQSRVNLNQLTLTALVCAFIPWGQFVLGEISSSGVAWINSLYLFGFYLAIRTGERWEGVSPNIAGDFVFLSVVIAAIVSVGLQVHQWMGFEPITPWMLSVPGDSRFYANMAQPNKLGTLLLWGVVGCSWGVHRRIIHPYIGFAIVCGLLWGVALTESRTAWINAILLFTCAIWISMKLPSKRYLFAASVLLLLLLMFVIFQAHARQLILAGGIEGAAGEFGVKVRPVSDSVRLNGWGMLIKASLLQPWSGYGWGQIPKAQFLAMDHHVEVSGLFSQSHNLFLDLLIFNGYVLGGVLIGVLLWWLWRVAKSVQSVEQIHLLAFILVVGVHAMLEFPLHYANFLLPTGLVIGVLSAKIQWKSAGSMGWRVDLGCAMVVTMALWLTLFEYLRVENSFYGLRFENRGIQTEIEKYPRNIVALTQFSEYLRLARYHPVDGITADDLERMEGMVDVLPSPVGMYKLAEGFAFRGQPDKAQKWLKTICLTLHPTNCEEMKRRWSERAQTEEKIANIQWPE